MPDTVELVVVAILTCVAVAAGVAAIRYTKKPAQIRFASNYAPGTREAIVNRYRQQTQEAYANADAAARQAHAYGDLSPEKRADVEAAVVKLRSPEPDAEAAPKPERKKAA